jgi:hypothetical protein
VSISKLALFANSSWTLSGVYKRHPPVPDTSLISRYLIILETSYTRCVIYWHRTGTCSSSVYGLHTHAVSTRSSLFNGPRALIVSISPHFLSGPCTPVARNSHISLPLHNGPSVLRPFQFLYKPVESFYNRAPFHIPHNLLVQHIFTIVLAQTPLRHKPRELNRISNDPQLYLPEPPRRNTVLLL